jgi:hypothetical protein
MSGLDRRRATPPLTQRFSLPSRYQCLDDPAAPCAQQSAGSVRPAAGRSARPDAASVGTRPRRPAWLGVHHFVLSASTSHSHSRSSSSSRAFSGAADAWKTRRAQPLAGRQLCASCFRWTRRERRCATRSSTCRCSVGMSKAAASIRGTNHFGANPTNC